MARDMDRISTVILKCFFNCSHFAQFTYRVCFCIAFVVKWPINKRIPREDYERDTKLSHDLLISSFETRERYARTGERKNIEITCLSVYLSKCRRIIYHLEVIGLKVSVSFSWDGADN